jgi:hypothetical protein
MNFDSIQVKFGQLTDVVGHARSHENVAIVPAIIGLSGSPMTNGSFLKDYLAARNLPAEIKALIHPGEDAPWACGRIQSVFSIPQIPDEDRAEKSCMGFSFLAAIPEEKQLVGIPFECTDYYGKSVLIFSGDAPAQKDMDRIARAFWEILLEKPHDVPDYADHFFHTGAGVEVRFGIQDGEPFMMELRDQY